jgi:hypothetical protein
LEFYYQMKSIFGSKFFFGSASDFTWNYDMNNEYESNYCYVGQLNCFKGVLIS